MTVEGLNHTINIIIAISVVLMSVVFYLTFHRFKTTKRCVLVLGKSGAGKTLIHSRLVFNCFKRSANAKKDTISEYITEKGNTINLLVVPSNDEMRRHVMDRFKKSARGIIFVIDSSSVKNDIKDIAEFLFNILNDTDLVGTCNDFLIFCNKRDKSGSNEVELIKILLEKELNALRTSNIITIVKTDGHEATPNNSFFGSPASDFVFEQLYPLVVQFAEGFANDGDEAGGQFNLDELISWIDNTS